MFVAILFGFTNTTELMKICMLMYIKLASLLNFLGVQMLKKKPSELIKLYV